MFGYVTAVKNRLSGEQWKRYGEFYCGLCRELGENGLKYRATLTYDMTFLEILLGGVLGGEETEGFMRCPLAPLKKKSFRQNVHTAYAADMNLLLAAYKLLDDWKDDRSLFSAAGWQMLSSATEEISRKYPSQSGIVRQELSVLSELEKKGENNPDIPAASFARLMAGLFSVGGSEPLAAFGYSLGRLVYIMDACVDFENDLRHGKYNPMAAYTKADFEYMLNALAADCIEKYNALGCQRDNEIIENILYCGIWTRYYKKYRTERKDGGEDDTEPLQRFRCFGERK